MNMPDFSRLKAAGEGQSDSRREAANFLTRPTAAVFLAPRDSRCSPGPHLQALWGVEGLAPS